MLEAVENVVDDESSLIPNNNKQNDVEDIQGGEVPPRHKRRSPTWLLPTASLVASLGGVLFGYDIGIISGAILLIKKEFMLEQFQKEMIVTMLLVGGLFASFTGGFILDRYGRKMTIIMNAFIFLAGAAILTLAPSYYYFVIGRFIVGFAVSLSAVGDCVYISEIAPPHKRGFLVSLNELGITFGILLAYLVNYLFINVPNGWRIMFGISGIPALIQAVSMIFLPASPRWLITKGREAKAEELIQVLWPYLDTKKQLSLLKQSLSTEKNYRFFDLFTNRENLRLRMFIGCGIILFQQLTGQPTVIYYAPTLFQTLGFNGKTSSILATVGLGIVKFIFTFITLSLVDRLGRRTFLLLGALIITVSLITLTAVTQPIAEMHRQTTSMQEKKFCAETTPPFYNKSSHMLDSGVFNSTIHEETNNEMIPDSIKYTSLVALMMFVIGYAIGYGPMSWLILTEIFPTGIKGRAVALASSVNWAANIVTSISFLEVICSIGPFWTFFIYALISVVSVFFLCHFVPETKGKSLEVIGNNLINRKATCRTLRCCTNGHMILIDDDENDWLLDDEGEPINTLHSNETLL